MSHNYLGTPATDHHCILTTCQDSKEIRPCTDSYPSQCKPDPAQHNYTDVPNTVTVALLTASDLIATTCIVLSKTRDRRARLPGRVARPGKPGVVCDARAVRPGIPAHLSRHPCTAARPSILRCFPFKFTYFLTHDVTCDDTQEMAEEIEIYYFARTDDSAFWADRERVKTQIELHEHYSCLWNVRSNDYQTTTRTLRKRKQQ